MSRRIGVLTLPDRGHLNPHLALAAALRRRGHEVAFLQIVDRTEEIAALGFDTTVLALDLLPPGWLTDFDAWRASRSGVDLNLATLERFAVPLLRAMLRDAPVFADSCDALVLDPYCYAGGSVASALGIPAVVVASALHTWRDPGCSYPCVPLRWQRIGMGLRDRALIAVGHRINRWVARGVLAELRRYRRSAGLPPVRWIDDEFRPFPWILPQPRGFEPAADRMPEGTLFAGPLTDLTVRPRLEFPWHRLDGRPLVYAALGTLLNHQPRLLHAIAAAAAANDAQAVIALGRARAAAPADLPGDPVVVDVAPQLELLAHAAACVTHAGLNTTVEAIAAGVPLVAVPLGYDQPGVAMRIAWSGCGVVVPPEQAEGAPLAEALGRVLCEPRFRQTCARLRAGLPSSGAEAAADVVGLLPARRRVA